MGYSGQGERTVWGKRHFVPDDDDEYRPADYCDSMTKRQATKAVKTMPESGAILFELVPVMGPE